MSKKSTNRGLVLALSIVLMLIWVVYLRLTLPRTYAAQHWRMAWIGFDIALFISLINSLRDYIDATKSKFKTGYISATLLFVDSWFDVVTSQRHDRLLAICMALFIQIPLGVFLYRGA